MSKSGSGSKVQTHGPKAQQSGSPRQSQENAGQGQENAGLLRLSLTFSLGFLTSQSQDSSDRRGVPFHLSVADFLYLLTLPEASALITMANNEV